MCDATAETALPFLRHSEFTLGGQRRGGAAGASRRGARRFPSGGAALPKASDKNGGLFSQRAPRSFFSHRARQHPATPNRYAERKKPDMFLKTRKYEYGVSLFKHSSYSGYVI